MKGQDIGTLPARFQRRRFLARIDADKRVFRERLAIGDNRSGADQIILASAVIPQAVRGGIGVRHWWVAESRVSTVATLVKRSRGDVSEIRHVGMFVVVSECSKLPAPAGTGTGA